MIMSTTAKQKKTDLRNVTWGETREGSPCPEVKMANEIVCDHGWDKLYPISVTHSKWYIRRAPFVLRAQPLGVNLLSRCWPA
jgi:hypothetical protein